MSLRSSLALGVWLASRGAVARSGVVLAAVGAVAAAAVTAAASGRAAARMPWFTAEIVAWGAGVTVAFGGALHALRRDRDEGVVALARARGTRAAAYVQGRVGGLAIVVAATAGAPTLAAGIVAASLARPTGLALQVTVGALAYVLAFAATIAPVAFAALGARSRVAGYLSLVAVVGLPEILAPWTSQALPRGWSELTSIPAALSAVGGAFASTGAALHAARALVGLLAVAAAALVVVVARMPDADARGSA